MSRPTTMHRRSTKTEYIETDTGNKISRRAHIEGKQNIMLGGKSVVMAGVHMRGDLHRLTEPSSSSSSTKPSSNPDTSTTTATPSDPSSSSAKPTITSISIGRSTILSPNSTLHPPMRIHHGKMTFYPMRIGDNVFIGPGTFVSAASIASHVHVGANCVLSSFCVIRESCKILPGTVVPSNMVIPAGSVVAGRPAKIVGEVGDGWGQMGMVGGEGNEEWVEGGDLRGLVRSIK